MAITAAVVKELRERTGAGMMECKKALTETDGDIEASIEHMRKSGLAKADKKAGRVAAEGMVVIEISADGKKATMVEVNSETDFVTKGDDFQNLAGAIYAHEGITNGEVLKSPLRDRISTAISKVLGPRYAHMKEMVIGR